MHHFFNWNRAFYAGFPKYCGRGLQEDFPMFTSPSQIPTYRVHSQTFTNYFFQLTLRTQSIIFFHATFSSRTFAQSHPLHFFLSKCLRCYVTNLKWVIALSFLSQNLLYHHKLSPYLSHILLGYVMKRYSPSTALLAMVVLFCARERDWERGRGMREVMGLML